MESSIVDIIIVFIGLIGLVLMGLRFSKSNENTEDYFLAGRSMPGWLIGISLVGTSLSSITFLALPAAAFALDWRLIVNNLMLPIGVIFAVFVFIPLFRKRNITTAFEYLENRFGAEVRIYGALSFIILQLLRLSTVLYLVSLPISFLLNVPVVWVVIVGGFFISVYTMFGGIKGVIWTDLIQTIVLLGGGVICMTVIVITLPGGFSDVISIGIEQEKFSLGDFDWNFAERTFWTMIILGIFQWITDYSSNQTIIQRYLSSSSNREAKRGAIICGLASIPLWAFFFLLGTALFAFYTTHPGLLSTELPADEILPYFLQTEVAVGVTGIIVFGILAAAMSTLDSGINSISTVVIVDIVKRFSKKQNSKNNHLSLARMAAGLAGLCMIVGALIYHQVPKESMLDLQIIVTALFGGCLGGLFLTGIFTIRVNNKAALFAVALAILCNLFLVLNQLGLLPDSWHFVLHPYWVGIFVNALFVIVAYILSFVVKPKKALDIDLTVWGLRVNQEGK